MSICSSPNVHQTFLTDPSSEWIVLNGTRGFVRLMRPSCSAEGLPTKHGLADKGRMNQDIWSQLFTIASVLR